MEYQVPQFIEVEDKIVGPLTLRQFIYIAGVAGLCIVFFSFLPIIFAVLASIPVVAFGSALAFYKVNGKSFIEILEAGFNYYTSERLLLWKHRDQKIPEKTPVAEPPHALPVRNGTRLTRGKLSELAWSLDVSRKPAPPGSSSHES